MRTRSFRDAFVPEEHEPRVVAELSARALLANYQAIHALVPHQSMLPMIKANAYGHGAAWAARNLVGMEGLYGLGVATLEEGAEIRKVIEKQSKRTRIIVVSGSSPWSESKGQYCERHGLTPSVVTDGDWEKFLKGGWPERIPYEIKFNTGMNRLGLSTGMARPIARALKDRPAEHHPLGIFSHLAIGESPDHPLSRQQRERFAALRSELAPACPAAHFHLANSSAIWNEKHWGLKELTDVVRPGISLYGVPPWAGAPVRGIEPVMCLRAAVIARHKLKRGDSIGYGATFKVATDEPVHAAVLSAGYADGIKRMLSNKGHVWLGGALCRMIGIVSMDLSAVSCSAGTQVGEWAEILGPHIDVWAQAAAAGTLPYELLTSVSQRVKREYG